MEAKKISFDHGLLQTGDLAKQIEMADKLLRTFSGFVSFAVKRFRKPDGIQRL